MVKPRTSRILTVAAVGLALILSGTPFGRVLARPYTDLQTTKGRLAIALTNLGYFGNAFSNRNAPSGEYPQESNVEHIYRGGIWVGAKTPEGELRVSTGAQDANGLSEGNDIREFIDDYLYLDEEGDEVDIGNWSNRQNDDNYSSQALANQHFEFAMNDYFVNEAGRHVPLGIKVLQRVLVWSQAGASDFAIFDYRVINISGNELTDVYVGMWLDTTVGSTDLRDPYDSSATVRWNYYDDVNGAFGPVDRVPGDYTVPEDPNIWMAYEKDEDGDEGLATSWIGYRLLGSNAVPEPEVGVREVSYNAWAFRGVPEFDDWYRESDDPNAPLLPGKYQIMSNGDFDVGTDQENDFARAGNWVSLMSTGPFRTMAPDDTLQVTYAVVAGVDSLALLANSKVAQTIYDNGLSFPGGPPSPKLEFSYADDSVIIVWEPGTDVDDNGDPLEIDDPARSPEHHISEITGNPDFQGYRVYRYQAEDFSGGLPEEVSQLVAEYDVVDGIGFDTGLPPLNEDGKREFVDTNLLSGFPYFYAVTSFSTPNPEMQLESQESGYYENYEKLYPGPAPAGPDNPRTVGVYPNPYRAGSMYDSRDPNKGETGRRIWFTGLPPRCTIKIFTLVGELVQTLHHDDPVLGQEPWNLLSSYDRVIATGLYVYVVEDLDTGEVQRGKLVIIK